MGEAARGTPLAAPDHHRRPVPRPPRRRDHPALMAMPLGFGVLIRIALLAPSVAISIWRLLPAAVVTRRLQPEQDPGHAIDRHEDLASIAQRSLGEAAPLREAGPKVDRRQFRSSGCQHLIHPKHARLA